MKRDYEAWLEFARRDLEAGKALTEKGQFANACFHAQQTLEKALKGLVLFRGKPVPKIHALPELLLLAAEPALAPFRDAFDELNKYYVPTRYPDMMESEEPSWFNDPRPANAACIQAEKILEIVTSLITAPPPKG